MKKYIAPQMKVVKLDLQSNILEGSTWNMNYTFGVDSSFGAQGAFE